MSRTFTVAEAHQLMPEVLSRADEVVELRADLAELGWALQEGRSSSLGGLPEAKAFEARLDEVLRWFGEQGLQVKGIAPLLLDFPSVLDGEDVLLCWLEGERELGWYHPLPLGFMGRRRLPTE
jgi:hypothetical protein